MTDILHFFVDNSSLWSGAQCYVLPSLVITFEFYSFTACNCSANLKCHFLIRQDHGFGSLCEPYQLQLKEQH